MEEIGRLFPLTVCRDSRLHVSVFLSEASLIVTSLGIGGSQLLEAL